QFDANIPSEGVIVYRVQTSDPLGHAQNSIAPIQLLTTTALAPGMSFTSDTQVKVQVNNTLPGGFSVSVSDPHAVVPDVVEMSAGGPLIPRKRQQNGHGRTSRSANRRHSSGRRTRCA